MTFILKLSFHSLISLSLLFTPFAFGVGQQASYFSSELSSHQKRMFFKENKKQQIVEEKTEWSPAFPYKGSLLDYRIFIRHGVEREFKTDKGNTINLVWMSPYLEYEELAEHIYEPLDINFINTFLRKDFYTKEDMYSSLEKNFLLRIQSVLSLTLKTSAPLTKNLNTMRYILAYFRDYSLLEKVNNFLNNQNPAEKERLLLESIKFVNSDNKEMAADRFLLAIEDTNTVGGGGGLIYTVGAASAGNAATVVITLVVLTAFLFCVLFAKDPAVCFGRKHPEQEEK